MKSFLKDRTAKITWIWIVILCLLISGGVTFFMVWYLPSLNINPGDTSWAPKKTDQGYHIGPITLYNYVYWTHDSILQTSSIPTVKFYHANKVGIIGTVSSSTVTGQILSTDQDVIYMAADNSNVTGYFVDPTATLANGVPYITNWFPWDYNNDGKPDYGFTISLAALPTLTAGQQSWTATINLNVAKAMAVTSLDVISVTNSTAATHTSSVDAYCQNYVSGFTGEGYGTKLAYIVTQSRVEGSNATYFMNGTVTLKDIQVMQDNGKPYSISGTAIGGFNDATNKTYIYPITNYQNEANDILMYNWRGGGGSSNTINFHYSCLSWPGGAHRIRVTATFYFISPKGAISSITQVMEIKNTPYS